MISNDKAFTVSSKVNTITPLSMSIVNESTTGGVTSGTNTLTGMPFPSTIAITSLPFISFIEALVNVM